MCHDSRPVSRDFVAHLSQNQSVWEGCGDVDNTLLLCSNCLAWSCFHSTLLRSSTKSTIKYGLPILLVIFEALPCLLILFAVVRISIIAQRQKVQHRNKSKGRANQTKCENQRNSTGLRMILFVAFFFIFCYIFEVYYGTCITLLISYNDTSCNDIEILPMIQRSFLIANSAVNPFAYAYFKRDINEEVKRKINVLCRKRRLDLNAQPNTETEVHSVSLDEIL